MPEISEFKGNKTLNLNPEDKFSFSFGLAKAKLILKHLDAIKKFVATEGQSCETGNNTENSTDYGS